MKNTNICRFFSRVLFSGLIVTLLLFKAATASAAGIETPAGYTCLDALAADFLPLVPPDYTLESPQMTNYGTMGGASFFAKKEIKGKHSFFFSEYHFDLKISEVPSQLIKIQGPMYKIQLEQNIEKDMKSRHKDDSDPITGYDQPLLTKYAWGAGITQRVIHKFMGTGESADEIDYSCVYHGLIIDNLSIKQFTLSVSGVETLAEADQWAVKAAEVIGRIGLANLKTN